MHEIKLVDMQISLCCKKSHSIDNASKIFGYLCKVNILIKMLLYHIISCKLVTQNNTMNSSNLLNRQLSSVIRFIEIPRG
jgi:hypothetical protein